MLPLYSKDTLKLNTTAWAVYENGIYDVQVENITPSDTPDGEAEITIRFGDTPGLHVLPQSDVFRTREQANMALFSRSYEAVSRYLSTMKTRKQFEAFPLHHPLAGPDMDYAARIAYLIKRDEFNT